MFLILFLLAVLLVLYNLVIRNWSYFTDRNVKFERGLPLLGSLSSVILGRSVASEEISRIYNKFPNDRYIGMYEFGGRPSVMIRDAELVKQISIKDFDSFVNHNFHVDEETDPLIGRNLFHMKDQKWRDMRSILSPLFTGSKMRMMLSVMTDSFEEITSSIRQEISEKNPNGDALEYNILDLLMASTTDVIASCAFGIRINSLRENDNEFYVTGRAISSAGRSVKLMIAASLPKVAKFFKWKLVDQKYDDFFRNIVRNNIKQRKEQNIVRNDMIQIMLLAQQGELDLKEKEELADAGFATVSEVITARSIEKLKELTEDDFVAQCLVFFLAGFTGLARTMTFLCHELALQPDIQERLRQEIDETHESLEKGKVTYEALQRMKYLDQVISEIFRLWPATLLLDRRVNKQYTLENTDGSKMILQPNDMVWIPNFPIQRDPKYFPNPEKFDPDRFSTENRKSINSAAYMPFGFGPRACVASRFALMELKTCIYYLVLNFYIECSKNTQIPLKFLPGTFSLDVEKGFWLQLKLRNKQ